MAQAKRPFFHGLSLLIIVLAIGLIGWKFPIVTQTQIIRFWLAIMVLLAAFVVIAGHGITGLWRGALIDERNKISLSRLQLVLWTILILASFLTAVLINIHRGGADPLKIALPETLWALMGISTTSLIGSPLIRGAKKDAPTNEEEKNKTLNIMKTQGVDPEKVDTVGQIICNKNPDDASWSELFKGDEVGNAAHLDLGKIQMFYFTVVVWFAYAIALISKLKGGSPIIDAFPDVGSGMMTLLGISHAGYLANQAVSHTSQKSDSSSK